MKSAAFVVFMALASAAHANDGACNAHYQSCLNDCGSREAEEAGRCLQVCRTGQQSCKRGGLARDRTAVEMQYRDAAPPPPLRQAADKEK